MTAGRMAGWYPLLLATAAIGVANSVVFSLLSNLQDKYGFSDTGLGLIAGSGFLVGLIGQVLLAPYADRGHSKTLLLAGLGMAVLGSVLFALSGSLLTLVASRAVVGLSNSLFIPASRAIAISIIMRPRNAVRNRRVPARRITTSRPPGLRCPCRRAAHEQAGRATAPDGAWRLEAFSISARSASDGFVGPPFAACASG